MKIFIYWNGLENNSKKIYDFLNSSEFICHLKKTNEVSYYKMFRDFQLEDDILKNLKESEIALFFTHGTEDAILKRSYIEDQLKSRYTFIDINNASLLSKKRVIAICCYSARQLGKYCTEDNNICETYIGFNDAIEYGATCYSSIFQSLIYNAYSDAFSDAFEYSLQFKCTAIQFVHRLKLNLLKMMTNEILSSSNRSLNSVSQPVFHIKAAKALIARGNIDVTLFN